MQEVADKTIYEYEVIKGEPHAVKVSNINPYLVDAPNIIVASKNEPLLNFPVMRKDNEATDDGHLSLTEVEKNELIKQEPNAEKWIRPSIGGIEFLNGGKRWCLWLVDIKPNELRSMPKILERIEKVKEFRLASPKKATIDRASTPWLFGENRQPSSGNYILVPKVSSERRLYAPIAFMSSETVTYNTVQFIPNAGLDIFGLVQSGWSFRKPTSIFNQYCL